jgi:hypothetical protein
MNMYHITFPKILENHERWTSMSIEDFAALLKNISEHWKTPLKHITVRRNNFTEKYLKHITKFIPNTWQNVTNLPSEIHKHIKHTILICWCASPVFYQHKTVKTTNRKHNSHSNFFTIDPLSVTTNSIHSHTWNVILIETSNCKEFSLFPVEK